MAILLRGTKGSALTHAEVDGNFTTLNGNTTTHIANTSNPHGTTAAQVGADPVGTAVTTVSSHVAAADDHLQYAITNPLAATVTYNAAGTTTVTLDGGRTEVFQATAATGGTTWAFTGAVASGKYSAFALELTNGGSQTQNWPASVKWDGGTAPTLTAAGLDILTFYTRDSGVTWRGFLAAKDSK